MSDQESLTTPNTPKDENSGHLAPVLPLRDIVVFPHMIVPLFVGREKSVRALEEVMNDEKQILLLTQKNKDDDDPSSDGLHRIGTLATVLQLLKLPDQTVRVLVEGKGRARVTGFVPRSDFFQATIETIPDSVSDAKETEALIRTVKTNFEQYIKLNKKVPAETLASVAQIEDAAKLADTVASHLSVKIADRQALLETLDTVERLEKVLSLIESEIGVLQVERKIRIRVKRQMEKTQREYYLNEQLKAIQKELGEGDEGRDEMNELEERIRKTKLSKEAREKANGEVKKLRSDVADERRSHCRAQLSRLAAVAALGQEVQGQQGHHARRESAERGPLRSREGQGTHPRISRGAAARRQDEGTDPVPRRPAGRRQDLARQVDRQGDGARIRAHVARRRA